MPSLRLFFFSKSVSSERGGEEERAPCTLSFVDEGEKSAVSLVKFPPAQGHPITQKRTYLEAFPENCEHTLWIRSDDNQKYTMTSLHVNLRDVYKS